MKRKLGAMILAATLAAAAAPPAATAAGPMGRSGGYGSHGPAGGGYHESARTQERFRLRDGSGIDPSGPGAGTMEKRGFTHGPGDGTGNSNDRPTDGTGYGSPSNR